MPVKIEFETGNAAFEDDETWFNGRREVEVILEGYPR
jgi:hypothetical protein